MRRMVEMFTKSKHRFIIVMGPNEGKIALPPNVWGRRNLPQIAILPKVDLIITHGGNNSVLEGLLFGRPLIVNPLFADQYDNAQRLEEKGFGYRVNAYKCPHQEMLELIEKIVNDSEMYARLEVVSKRLQQCKSTEKAAEAIVRLADSD